MIALYPNPWYIVILYKGTGLYLVLIGHYVLQVNDKNTMYKVLQKLTLIYKRCYIKSETNQYLFVHRLDTPNLI